MNKFAKTLAAPVAVGLMLSLGACDGLSRLRSFFHPEESPQGFEGSTSLDLTIVPAENLNIFLDGELVGHASPYAARFLPAGQHQLLIEADGYRSFSMVLDLAESESLSFPVSLRQHENFPEQNDTPAVNAGPALPADIKPAQIEVQSPLGASITIDGEPVQSPHILARFWGSISVGDFSVSYRYDQFGRLQISLPGYAARWVVNDAQVNPGSTQPFYEGTMTILEHRPEQPTRQLTLRRP